MKRQVLQDDICDSCSLESKSIGHILWRCPKAHEAWGCINVLYSNSGNSATIP